MIRKIHIYIDFCITFANEFANAGTTGSEELKASLTQDTARVF